MGSVSVTLLRPLAFAVGSAGLDSWLGATDVTAAMLADDDARVTAAQFCVAWSEAIRLTGEPRLALRIASAIPAGGFGIVEYVCKAAPTVGDALRSWVRYLNLLDDAVTVALVVDRDLAQLRVERDSEAPAPASHELCWALVARYARELSAQPFRITRVDFAHPARSPDDAAHYRAHFTAPVVFEAECTQLVMPASVLAASLRSADPALLAILTRAADDLAKRTTSDPPLISQVSRAIGEALRTDQATIEHIADLLGMTTRSLQRRLKDEHTSFQELRERVRRSLATRYLDDGLTIAEISFLLGFSEPSAFFRAFKRWTGTTPIEARRRLAEV